MHEGWLCTGDIAVVNAEGLLEIKGRNDDLIIKAGMNIYPQELESALKADSRVREALAYGYTAAAGTQIGLKIAGDFASADEVRRLCMEVLAGLSNADAHRAFTGTCKERLRQNQKRGPLCLNLKRRSCFRRANTVF